MIELDYAQRVESSLPPRLRAKLRWVAADANRCGYGKVYARTDFVRAGGAARELDDLSRQPASLPEPERLAVQFVRRLTEAAYAVTDAQVARLIELPGFDVELAQIFERALVLGVELERLAIEGVGLFIIAALA